MIKKTSALLLALVTIICMGCGDTQVQDYPTNLNGTNSTSQEYLGWSAVYKSMGYNVYRGNSSGDISTKTRIAANISDIIYIDNAVTPGTHYYYQVTSINPGGESRPSYEIEVVP